MNLNWHKKCSLCVLSYVGRGLFSDFFEKQGQIVTVWSEGNLWDALHKQYAFSARLVAEQA